MVPPIWTNSQVSLIFRLESFPKDDQWDGPGEVQATESKTIWITHNGQLKKVASCRLRPWIQETESSEAEESTDDEEESDWEVPVDDAQETADSNITLF